MWFSRKDYDEKATSVLQSFQFYSTRFFVVFFWMRAVFATWTMKKLNDVNNEKIKYMTFHVKRITSKFESIEIRVQIIRLDENFRKLCGIVKDSKRRLQYSGRKQEKNRMSFKKSLQTPKFASPFENQPIYTKFGIRGSWGFWSRTRISIFKILNGQSNIFSNQPHWKSVIFNKHVGHIDPHLEFWKI